MSCSKLIQVRLQVLSNGLLPVFEVFIARIVGNIMRPTGKCKKDVTPLLTHWSYVFLALTHQYFLVFLQEETVDGNSSVTTLEALPSGGVLNSSGIEVITLNPGEQHLHITEVTPDVTTDLRLKDTEASALLSEDTPADELTENDNDNVTTSGRLCL